ncbi:adenosine deaminase [Georgenia sp. TF02-10]|uniref:adenosine deaminase n=1 Tax=Georgenia sp. TF02-10 TaxID=2917725 RepID=UPI001FA7E5CF|nr:adenosine deaminase [Georgenia sp. TF02-10]UNX53863.1 adenosine deaminase [Georgenia sp. TF02-10]
MPTPTPLPTAELHVHLEGTLEPEHVYALAERNRVRLPYADVADLRSRLDFTGLQHFLDLYYANMAVLRTEEDFADLTRAYLRRAARGGVRHAEVFLDLQAHTARGVPAEVVLAGVTDALAAAEREHGLSAGLIVTFLRHLPGDAALAALTEVLRLDAPLLGVGLCSSETGSAAPFRDAFALAAAHGLRRVAHAGEEGPAANVTEVLDVLGAERVDHGIRALEDDAVVERLAAEQVPLTLCPLSNVRLRVVRDLAAYPLRQMLRRGLRVTVNSDDPAYFGGYVDDNIRALTAALDLTADELATLARNAVDAAFVGDARRAELRAEVESWVRARRDEGA